MRPAQLKCTVGTKNAPVLRPADVAFLAMTNPRPQPDPYLPLFLHGELASEADVSIVWRADCEIIVSPPAGLSAQASKNREGYRYLPAAGTGRGFARTDLGGKGMADSVEPGGRFRSRMPRASVIRIPTIVTAAAGRHSVGTGWTTKTLELSELMGCIQAI